MDLIKVNIEGREFGVLPALLKHEIINKIGNIRVQVHDFVEGVKEKINIIGGQLRQTHELIWDYRFIWENWQIKNKIYCKTL